MPCTHYQQLSRHKRFGSAGSKKFHILLNPTDWNTEGIYTLLWT